MAVMGPNCEGFANTAACNPVPDLQPGGRSPGPPAAALPPARPTLAVIAQSGGMGSAFYDGGRAEGAGSNLTRDDGQRGLPRSARLRRPHHRRGRHRRAADADRGHQDGSEVRSASPRRRCGRASPSSSARSASPTRARGGGLAHGGAGRLVREFPGDGAPLRHGRGPRPRRDGRSRAGFPRLRLPICRGRRVGICTASGGGGGWMADACSGGGLDVPEFDAPTRESIDEHLPSYGTSQNPVDGTAQAIRSSATRGSRAGANRRSSTASSSVMSGRNGTSLERRARGARASSPPRPRSRS